MLAAVALRSDASAPPTAAAALSTSASASHSSSPLFSSRNLLAKQSSAPSSACASPDRLRDQRTGPSSPAFATRSSAAQPTVVHSPRTKQKRAAALSHARQSSRDKLDADDATTAAAPSASAAPFVPFLPFIDPNFKPAGVPDDDSTDKIMSSDRDSAAGKSEDGRTVVIGEARLASQPMLITQTSPPADDVAAATPDVAPMITETKGTAELPNAPAVVEEDKLAPPPPQLDAPLDTMRPDAQQQAAGEATNASNIAAAATSSSQPNALADWDAISASLAGKSLVVFLDYDGTLTPIVSEPSKALITAEQRARVARLASKCPVSIVTGRKMATIKSFVLGDGNAHAAGLDSLYFAGSHGFDISCPATAQGSRRDKRVAEDYLPMLHEFYTQCERECKSIPGALVEDSVFSISVHYRNCSEADAARIDAIVRKAMQPFESKLQRHAGKMVHEIRPNIDWNKGKAVEYLLQLILAPDSDAAADPAISSSSSAASSSAASPSISLRTPSGQPIVPVYLGDDTTDEDAFRFLRALGQAQSSDTKPLTIFVRPDDKARPSAAHYTLSDPDEVGQMLERLANL